MLTRLMAALGLLLSGLVVVVGTAAPASADPGQLGAPEITLNPGGGVLPDGSDGLRFSINSAAGLGRATQGGHDQLFYRNTWQYNYDAGAPLLNVGGTLFGPAGPGAYDNSNWSSLTVLSTSGSTSQGPRTSATGDASARLRYVASKNGRDYVVERTVSYTYPNDFVVDSYEFTIPEGNTEQVKFYLGGDTGPGSVDVGVGVMLTEPTRSVISVNPSSGIQFGFQEIADSKPFDGASSQTYSSPYSAVQSGGDIGFTADPATHDAGLLMQWNLGATPGTQRAALRQFVNQQGTNLKAGFDRTFAAPDEAVSLDIVIENTRQSARSDLSFTIDLPVGTVKAAGSVTNSCGGTASVSAGSVSLSGGSVAALANCVISVPVSAATTGTYTLGSANVRALGAGLTNTVGTTSFFVPEAPRITTAVLGVLTYGTSTSQTIVATGVPAPTFAVTAGSLPAGLTLNSETGVISGTPTAAGAYSFTVTATNSGGNARRAFNGTVAKGHAHLSQFVATNTEYGTPATLTVRLHQPSATGELILRHGQTELCRIELPATSCTTPADLALGLKNVDVTYTGDANWTGFSSADIGSFTVAATTTTLAAELERASVAYGSSVDVDVAVTPASATGTVTVTSAGETLCTVTLPGSSCTVGEDLEPGDHTIAASYSGDDFRAPSTAVAGTLTITRATPSPTSSDVVTVYGERFDLALADLPGTATGTVTFSLDDEELCSYDVTEASDCTVDTVIPAGEHTVDVAYSGDDRFEPVADELTLTVAKASTALTTAAAFSGTYGVGATTAAAGLPAGATGTITVSTGGETLCSWAIGSGTGCTLPADLSAGEHQLLVSYSGDANHLGSDATSTLTIARAVTTIVAPGPIAIDRRTEPVVRVTGLPTGATGTVTVGNDDLGVVCTFDAAATDRCAGDELAPGTYELAVAYAGDANHLGSSATVTVAVARDATVVEPAEPTVTGTYGAPVTIGFDNLPADATGTVKVTVTRDSEEVELCEITLPGERTCSVDSLPAGTYDLALTYSGDSVYAGSTSDLELTVDKAPVTLDLDATLVSDGTVVDEIRVGGLPKDATGRVTVTMAAPSARYATTAASVGVLAPAAGTVVCTFEAQEADSCAPQVAFTPGTHTLAVSYAGDANYLAAQGQITLQVASPAVAEDVDPSDSDSGSDEAAGDDSDSAKATTDAELADTGVSLAVALGLPIALALVVLGGFLTRRGRESLA